MTRWFLCGICLCKFTPTISVSACNHNVLANYPSDVMKRDANSAKSSTNVLMHLTTCSFQIETSKKWQRLAWFVCLTRKKCCNQEDSEACHEVVESERPHYFSNVMETNCGFAICINPSRKPHWTTKRWMQKQKNAANMPKWIISKATKDMCNLVRIKTFDLTPWVSKTCVWNFRIQCSNVNVSFQKFDWLKRLIDKFCKNTVKTK